jgi:8-oxo-dGTP pyrophosphatase MutT (NUDIX family)
MKQMTVCFLLRHAPALEVLLGFKKAGFGSGKYTGIGGKVEPAETVEAAAKREVEEEIGVTIPDECLQYMGKVTFLFPFRPQWTQEVFIFLANQWQGELKESDEIKPFWFEPDEIPYEAMWQDARDWIPLILQGNKIQATISFKDDNETVHEVCVCPLLQTN